METEQIRIIARALFGFQLTIHYLFSDLPLGLASLGLVLGFIGLFIKNNHEENRKKFVQFFAISWILAGTSALMYELEYRHNWLGVDIALDAFYRYPWLTDVPELVFFITGIILVIAFKQKFWVSDLSFFLLILLLFASAVISIIWSITANTLMQLPEGVRNVNDRLEITTELSQIVFSNYNIARLTHVIGSATVKAGVMIGLTIAVDYKRNLAGYPSYHRIILKLVAIFIIITAISGHSKVLILAEKRPATFLMLEGIKDTASKSDLHLFCLPNLNSSPVGLSLKNGVKYLLSAKVYNSLNSYIGILPYNQYGNSIFIVYHLMIWGWLALTIAIVFALRVKRPIVFLQLIMLALVLFSSLCGWYVAEMGRQPWAFWGMIKVNNLITPGLSPEHLHASIIATVVNTIILFIITILATILIARTLKKT